MDNTLAHVATTQSFGRLARIVDVSVPSYSCGRDGTTRGREGGEFSAGLDGRVGRGRSHGSQ
jgi:hypothetical protein